QTTFGAHHTRTSELLHAQGIIYVRQADFARALTHLTQTLDIQRKTLGPHHFSVAGTLQDIAKLYLEQSDYGRALDHAIQALNIYETLFATENHPQIARTFIIIGNILNQQGIHAHALSCYQQALAMLETSYDRDHPDVAITLHNIANIYSHRREY